MKCFWCLVAFQSNEREDVEPAAYVYDGISCCETHINVRRGLPATFQRYPKDMK